MGSCNSSPQAVASPKSRKRLIVDDKSLKEKTLSRYQAVISRNVEVQVDYRKRTPALVKRKEHNPTQLFSILNVSGLTFPSHIINNNWDAFQED